MSTNFDHQQNTKEQKFDLFITVINALLMIGGYSICWLILKPFFHKNAPHWFTLIGVLVMAGAWFFNVSTYRREMVWLYIRKPMGLKKTWLWGGIIGIFYMGLGWLLSRGLLWVFVWYQTEII